MTRSIVADLVSLVLHAAVLSWRTWFVRAYPWRKPK